MNSTSYQTCPICSANHYVAVCPKYSSKTVQQRMSIIAKHKLCYNCLGSHRSSACRVTKRCLKCGHKHHTTIHQLNKFNNSASKQSDKINTTQPNTDHTNTKTPVASGSTVLHSTTALKVTSCILLATAQVLIQSQKGYIVKARALIDQGSEISLITERLVQRLHLTRQAFFIPLVGIGAKTSMKTKGLVSFKIKPHFQDNFEVESQTKSWNHLSGLKLADPEYNVPGSIDLILDADFYSQIIKEGISKGEVGSPLAQCTTLGWIISGPSSPIVTSTEVQSYHVSMDKKLYDLIHRFWELNTVPEITTARLSAEEEMCEKHFKETYSRDSNGRYQLRLPFKFSTKKLGDSKTKAIRVMTSLSKRLLSKNLYSQLYSDFMEEYKKMQHMTPVDDQGSEPQHCFYLPHHGVLRENSKTTKLRVVFNGSSNTTTGLSLNDLLYKGAKLQTELFDVLLWFRKFPYVFSSDMEKMYQQINIHPEDWKFQRILWNDQVGNILTYQLTTVTYGLACAPYQALRTLLQLIEDEGKTYPLAVPTMMKGRYVDDIFGGADSVQQAQEIVRQLKGLCMAGNFPLHKWETNVPEILCDIPLERRVRSSAVSIEEKQIIHALGLVWNPTTDAFSFTLKLSPCNVITKRSILSFIAKMFDPLGFLSPVMIKAKIFVQELWSIKIGWDDPLPELLSQRWNNFIEQLQTLPSLIFPRWVGITFTDSIEIHGFCDASQHAMAATIYVKATTSDKTITVKMLCAKTKVAPLKCSTIPRLELCGAVLLTKLVAQVIRVFQNKDTPIFLWTDSAVSFTWINNHPSKWKDFVHNRVCFIQETLPQAVWKFVPGNQNPADYATQGLTPAQLSLLPEWWHGPVWLSQSSKEWPDKIQLPKINENLEERPNKVATIVKDNLHDIWNLIHKYSNLTRLLRITATCSRAIARLRRTGDSLGVTPLTAVELEHAKTFWLQDLYVRPCPGYRLIRWRLKLEEYDYEIIHKSGQSNVNVDALSRYPAENKKLIHHVEGEREQREYTAEQKEQTLYEYHDAPLGGHQGVARTLHRIKLRHHWHGLNKDVESYVAKCEFCQKNKLRHKTKMPLVITDTPTRPFEKCALDIVGPLTITATGNKYALTFQDNLTKFSKAIPLENQEANTVAKAFVTKIILEHGIPEKVLTDQGTNFTSEIFKNTCKLLKIHKIQTTAYHPESNGALERSHRTLAEYLRHYISTDQTDWDEWLPYVMFTYNTTPHTVTGLTPFELIYGHQAILPSALNQPPKFTYTYDDYAQELKERIRAANQIAKANSKEEKEKSKKYYDKKAKETSFKVGDKVLLLDETLRRGRSKKLEPEWIGPYTVMEKHNDVNYSVKMGRRTIRVHANRLKLFIEN
ncbi:PREDICTED: uncharacterized protein LOC105557283 [Vollenhovia emeryi]|uniref:uncharacterized protein LOC105557283 n=1 Tax=Vollenhovia emeryi TaxID=411798 RepID=UPI0005F4CCDB|nr:PREDICTED: uncharacterized protein LOC105557283 [Vollenhovia emeryi]